LADAPIKKIDYRLCYNSRGQLAIEVDIIVGENKGRAMAPSGASVGRNEAKSFPNGSPYECLNKIKSYSNILIGLDATNPQLITSKLMEIDSTSNYSKIGGAAAYAITIAAVDAAAQHLNIPIYNLINSSVTPKLPYPIGNFIGGGMHAGPGAPDIQEFLSCAVGAKKILDALQANVLVHKEARKIIGKNEPLFPGGKGDEGAWAASLSNKEAFEIASEAVNNISDKVGFKVSLGIDFAASSFWDQENKLYVYKRDGRKLSGDDQVTYVSELADKYNLIYLEDPLHEDAFEDFAKLTKSVKHSFVTGDDLLVTSSKMLEKATSLNSVNSAILKVNQAGTLGDALNFAKTAAKNNISLITSHRSGDTSDSHIAHVAVATSSKMLKTGIVGGERTAKLNELIRINESTILATGNDLPMIELLL